MANFSYSSVQKSNYIMCNYRCFSEGKTDLGMPLSELYHKRYVSEYMTDVGAYDPAWNRNSNRKWSEKNLLRHKFCENDLHSVLYGNLDCGKMSDSIHSISGIRLIKAPANNTDDSKSMIIHHPKLPDSLVLKKINFGAASHRGVFAKKTISAGTLFGPFVGSYKDPKMYTNMKCECAHSWELFKDGKIEVLVDATHNPDNWMKLVNCARYDAEQNLILIQKDMQIYYKVMRNITAGQELLIWYGDDYAQYMGIPISLFEDRTAKSVGNSTKKKDVSSTQTGSFPCERCGKIFSYEYYRDKHLKYTRCVDTGDRKFPCQLCQRSFEKKDRLRIHVLHVHQKYRPHVCAVCGKRFSQSSSLNKHLRVHTGERPYPCPHCPKAFTASSILRTHLRQHNGERPFKCKFCGKAFASHAAHDSHVRRTHDNSKRHSHETRFELKFHPPVHGFTNEDRKSAEHNSFKASLPVHDDTGLCDSTLGKSNVANINEFE